VSLMSGIWARGSVRRSLRYAVIAAWTSWIGVRRVEVRHRIAAGDALLVERCHVADDPLAASSCDRERRNAFGCCANRCHRELHHTNGRVL